MKHKNCSKAQMLLATGVVLQLSLLSMAIFSVKTAGLAIPHEPGHDDVIDASSDVQSVFPGLVKARAQAWVDAGVSEEGALDLALAEIHDDLLHHGEIRNVQVKLINMSHSNSSGVHTISAELGVADSKSMLTLPLSTEIEFD